jgi:membrane protein
VVVALLRAVRGFWADRGFFLAAGLSFYFLVCMVPMLFIVVSVAGFVLTSESAVRSVLGQVAQTVPVHQREIGDALRRIIATRRLSGVLGTLILIPFSTPLFAALRMIMNDIFAVRRGRGIVHGLLIDLLMVAVMGVLFLASVAITDVFQWLRGALFTPMHMPSRWVRWMFWVLGLGFSTALFYITYRYFPSRRVHAVAALAGAVLATGLWDVAKQLFRWYIASVGVYDQIYGPLGVLVAFIMFTYYTGIVVILGAEYASALEAHWRRRE